MDPKNFVFPNFSCDLSFLVLSPRKYTPLPDYISVKCHQFVHAFGNHGVGTVVFLSATIIFIFVC